MAHQYKKQHVMTCHDDRLPHLQVILLQHKLCLLQIVWTVSEYFGAAKALTVVHTYYTSAPKGDYWVMRLLSGLLALMRTPHYPTTGDHVVQMPG